MKKALAAFAVLALAVGLAACSDDDDGKSEGTTTTVAEKLTVTDAWARTSPASQENGAAYLTVKSNVADELVKAEVPADVAMEAQLHETTTSGADSGMDGSTSTSMGGSGMDDSTSTTMGQMMGMREVASIPVAAGKGVTLEPGGYHIMLMKLAKPLVVGEEFELTLTFDKAGTRTVTVVVSDTAP